MSSNQNNSMSKGTKAIIGVAIVIIVLIGGYFGYQEGIVSPKNEKAANAMVEMERFFQNKQFEEVINGDGMNQGALSIISQYGNTKSGNLANYYAGMSFLHLGEFEEAIKYLNQYKMDAGSPLYALAEGAKGDAYLELNNHDKAIEAYQKAINAKDNLTSPIYLHRIGMLYYQQEKGEQAISSLKEIKTEYPNSPQAQEVDKYLAYIGYVE